MKIKISIFILIITLLTFFVTGELNSKKNRTVITSAAPPVITPIESETTSSMDSPDGEKTLMIEKKDNFYTIFITNNSDGNKTQVFRKEKINSSQLEIPYNTWSPDNFYFFLKEKNASVDNYLVFQSSGESFLNNQPYLSIQEPFKINVPNYTIEEVTGWAGPNLLIVNAKQNDSDSKISFWYEVPSQAVIQLGTYFK
ncbi:MAG: hypothetical protein WCT22_02835 [Patescibacteria group bacterium]|jgi:hypothetical protein